MAPTRPPRRAATRRRRKTVDIDQRLLDAARRILGCETETETIREALARIVDNRRVADGIRALAGSRIVNASNIED
jgi:Arc/MetJ family transcription regulator